MDENELCRQIGHAVRRAAGLPPLDDPINDILRPDELHLPWLGFFIGGISGERFPTLDHVKSPRKVAQELTTIRHILRDLQQHMAGLDEATTVALNWAGSMEKRAYKKALESVNAPEDLPPVLDPRDCLPGEQYDGWDVQAVLDTMARLEVAAAEVEKQLFADAVREVAEKPSGSTKGRKPGLNKRIVAIFVAEYIRAVTGNVPTFWKSRQPSGPFAKALAEIFKLLHLPRGIDRAAEQAIEATKGNPRKFPTNEDYLLLAIPEDEFRVAARAAGMEWAPDEPTKATSP